MDSAFLRGPIVAHCCMPYAGQVEVLVDRPGRGSIPKRIWRWMKRRAAVEPTLGHLKSNYRLERNRLKGTPRRRA